MKTDEREFPRSLNEPQSVKVDEQVYRFSLSPFDLPVAYRQRYDSQARKFCIEFRYLGEESEKSEISSHDGKVTLRVGKGTGNLYEIRVTTIDVPGKENLDIAVGVPSTMRARSAAPSARCRPERSGRFRENRSRLIA